jgi:exopolyphosphatase / guanosine-5'-triphosphate,3'-diphosphate pyrophosphatase
MITRVNDGAAGQARVAVVDIGSNSIHLLVAVRAPDRRGYPVRRVMSPATLLGLGRTVAASGRIDAQAAAELTRVVSRQVKQAERARATELYLAATAAVRQAANGRERMAALGEAVGRPVRVLTAEREAELAFLGLLFELDPGTDQLVIDGGGASTEVILARGRRRVAAATLPIGSSALSAAHDDPPTGAQLDRLRERVEEALGELPPWEPAGAVATGGTARKLPVLLGGEAGDPLDLTTIERAIGALQAVPSTVLAKGTGLQRRRVQSLAAGAIILGALLRRYGLTRCRNSPHGLREGVVVATGDEPDSWWIDLPVAAAQRRRFEAALAGDAVPEPARGRPLAPPEPAGRDGRPAASPGAAVMGAGRTTGRAER